MTDTVVSSATKEVVIGFERPFVIIGERINPTGRKLLAAEMAAGDYSRVQADALAASLDRPTAPDDIRRTRALAVGVGELEAAVRRQHQAFIDAGAVGAGQGPREPAGESLHVEGGIARLDPRLGHRRFDRDRPGAGGGGGGGRASGNGGGHGWCAVVVGGAALATRQDAGEQQRHRGDQDPGLGCHRGSS